MSTTQETLKSAARRLAAGAMRDGYLPQSLHTYTDRDGQPLYWRIRAKNAAGDKWIRPMKLNGTGYVLDEPAAEEFPGGKPLYRLREGHAGEAQVVGAEPQFWLSVRRVRSAATRLGRSAACRR